VSPLPAGIRQPTQLHGVQGLLSDRKRAEGNKHTQALVALGPRRVNVLWAMLSDELHLNAALRLDVSIEILSRHFSEKGLFLCPLE
jgi:hypothetical protein